MGGIVKLIDKPFRAFVWYSLSILIISIPVYYLVVDFIWVSELDEHNQIIKEHIIKELDGKQISEEELNALVKIWKSVQPGTSLVLCDTCVNRKDEIYEISRNISTSEEDETDRFRGLRSSIQLNGSVYLIQIETNVEEADETFLAITLVTIFFSLVLVLGLIVLNKRINYKAWKPFYRILDELRDFDLTQKNSIHLQDSNIAEFIELKNTVQNLIEKSISAYQNQKTFIENASHELQTPLALLKSKLDVLSQKENVTEEQLTLFQELYLPLSRLTRINKNLLLLAKLDNHQFQEKEKVNLNQVFERSIDLLTDYIEEKKLILKTEFETTLESDLNLYLAETLVSNLLTNAIKYTPDKGRLTITINSYEIAICNSGHESLNRNELFKRFSKQDQKTEGMGLGLAIVSQICEQFGWDITYVFTNEEHKFMLRPKF